MGKSKSEKKPEGGSGSNGDAQLLEDVRAFAAQLGLGAGGVTGDDAFADFAPKAAKKKISKSKEATLKSDDSEAKVQSKPDRKETPKPAKPANGLPAAAPPPSAPASSSGRSLLKRDDMGLWYEIAATLPALKPDAKPPKPDFLALKQTEADQLLANEATAFENAAARQRGSNLQWLQQAQRGGTTSDKVAAMAVLVQEAPMANLRSLDGLVAMAGKRGGARAVVGTALDALKELWLDVLLPPNRKLKFLEQQPLGALPQSREGERCLLFWGFESALKQK